MGITFSDAVLNSETPDGRPSFILDHAEDITLKHVSAKRGTGQAWDIGVRSSSGLHVVDSPQLVVQHLDILTLV